MADGAQAAEAAQAADIARGADVAQAADVARRLFGIEGEARALPGEFDRNFVVAGPDGPVVLKLSPASRRPILELAAACLAHLAGARLSAKVPGLASGRGAAADTGAASSAGAVREVEFDGAPHVASVVTFVEGVPLATVRPKSMAVLEALGTLLAEVGRALSDFDHPGLDRAFPWRMESARDVVRGHAAMLAPGRSALALATLDQAWQRLDPVKDSLPTGPIHNDANDYNVLVAPSLKGVRLAGLIDFGDVARGWRVADPAVAAAYAMMDLPDPLEAACALAKGYSTVAPLGENECRALLPMAALRLCLSVCIQARQMKEQPDNEYLAVSQKPAWRLLETLAATDWRLGEFRVRHACGFEPNPRRQAVAAHLGRLGAASKRVEGGRPGQLGALGPGRLGATTPTELVGPGSLSSEASRRELPFPVMPMAVLERPHVLDLSVESLELPHPDDLAAPGAFEAWVKKELAAAGATIGVGRYSEARFLYDAPGFASEGNDGPDSRTIHLGLDLFAPAGTPVRAPLPGTVVSVADNALPLDYGPTVILRHGPSDDDSAAGNPDDGFHTLYGHLDKATLDHLAPGDQVAAGDVIGRLGDAGVNGGWPPHLHLQAIALDPLRDPDAPPEPGNFPGVALPRLRKVWHSIAPDPSALAGLPGAKTPAAGPTADPARLDARRASAVPGGGAGSREAGRTADPEAAARRIQRLRRRHLPPSLSLSYRQPIHAVRGLGSYLFDAEGRRFLDTVNNVPHVGHSNRRVAAAVARQARVLATNTRYLHGEIVALAEELAAHFPAPLDVVFLVCSGSEANELALRLARRHTGADGVIVLEGGYHGNTGGLVEISPYKFDGPGGDGRSGRVAVAPMPDPYRGRFRRKSDATSSPIEPSSPAQTANAEADRELGERYAAEVKAAARRLGRHGVAAFVAEPILSCGGQIEPPPGYLAAAYEHVRQAGGVCVADEVQTGFGRVGDAFWAFELQGVVPDVVTLGKPMGNGHPVAAVVTTKEIADSFANGMEYFNTFGGNPVSCAAARAVLAEVRDRGLQERARRTGDRLLGELRRLAARWPVVGDARGRGLFLGVEFVRDPATREPFPEACAYVVNRAREMGVLASADGPDRNVLKIKPPLVFGEAEADRLAETLETVLGESALG